MNVVPQFPMKSITVRQHISFGNLCLVLRLVGLFFWLSTHGIWFVRIFLHCYSLLPGDKTVACEGTFEERLAMRRREWRARIHQLTENSADDSRPWHQSTLPESSSTVRRSSFGFCIPRSRTAFGIQASMRQYQSSRDLLVSCRSQSKLEDFPAGVTVECHQSTAGTQTFKENTPSRASKSESTYLTKSAQGPPSSTKQQSRIRKTISSRSLNHRKTSRRGLLLVDKPEPVRLEL